MHWITVAHLAVFLSTFAAAADNSGALVAERVPLLTATTEWRAVGEIPLQFDAFHPQGMAIVNGAIYVSSVEVINRAQGKGKGHLFRIARDGAPEAQVELTDGPRYHPGGIDFDGARLWVPVAEYRPASSSVVYAVDPATLTPREVFRCADHLGAIVHDAGSASVVGVSWGSRRMYRWISELSGNNVRIPDPHAEPRVNRAHYVDFQDAQSLPGTTLMLCGGLKNYRGPNGSFSLGGLELIDVKTLEPKHQVPVPLWEQDGRPMLQNAFHAEATDTGLRFWFLPADGKATIYIYEPVLAER
jgi:hypothetical protein